MNAPKLCPALPLKCSLIVSSGRPSGPNRRVNFAAGDRADHAVCVVDGQGGVNLLAVGQGRFTHLQQQLLVERFLQPVILGDHPMTAHVRSHGRLVEHLREIQPTGLPMVDRLVHVQTVNAPDHFLDRAETQLRHPFAHFLGDESHEIHDKLRVAAELRPQLRVLRRHADGAGVEMAHPHHDAAERDQRRGGETEFLGAQ